MPLSVRTLETPAMTFHCPCCQGRPERFLPIPAAYVEECRVRGVEHPLDAWETLNLESYLCPLCGATDRDRLQVQFLQSWLEGVGQPPPPYPPPPPPPPPGKEDGELKVLDIAPSPAVSNWLRNRPEVAYRSADLYMSSADDCVDITDMACYGDRSFDLVICSHVLEHIPDDLRAMREIRRILAPGGIALLLVPISMLVESVIEDPELQDEEERWRRFGQGDHVRIYGRNGFVSRLVEAGFTVSTFEQCAPEPLGLIRGNSLYLAQKGT